MEEAEQLLAKLFDHPGDAAALAELQRQYHTIKGGARMTQVFTMGDLTHEAENVLEYLSEQQQDASPVLLDTLQRVQDTLAAQLDQLMSGIPVTPAKAEIARLKSWLISKDDADLLLSAPSTKKNASKTETVFPEQDLIEGSQESAAQELLLDTAVDIAEVERATGLEEDITHESVVPDELIEEQLPAEQTQSVATSDSGNKEEVSGENHPSIHEQVQPETPKELGITLVEPVKKSEAGVEAESDEANEQDSAQRLANRSIFQVALETQADFDDLSEQGFEQLVSLEEPCREIARNSQQEHPILARVSGHLVEIYEDLSHGRLAIDAEVKDLLASAHDWMVILSDPEADSMLPSALLSALSALIEDPDRFSLNDHKDLLLTTDQTLDEFTRQQRLDPAGANDPKRKLGFLDEQTDSAATSNITTGALESDNPASQDTEFEESRESLGSVGDTEAIATKQLGALKFETLDEVLARSVVGAASAPLVSQSGAFERKDADTALSGEQIRLPAQLMEQLINLSGEGSINRTRVEVSNASVTSSVEEMGITVQRLADQLRRLDIELEAQIISKHESAVSLYEDFDPLEMDRYSSLNQLSKSLFESASDLLEIKSTLLEKSRSTEGILLELSRLQSQLQEGLMSTRLIPVSRIAPRLERIARQTSRSVDKQIRLQIDNAEAEIDRSILDRITSPLEHMLRNAIDHGIEDSEQRAALGKPDEGLVKLAILRRGGELLIELSDDGSGIPVDKVREKAIERGLLKNLDATDQDVIQLIFHAGLSTASSLTQISGRGVGMDVVQSEIKQLGGSVEVFSESGKGTRFEIRVPLSVAITDALLIRSSTQQFALPVTQIDRIEQVKVQDLQDYYAGDHEQILIQDTPYRLSYLAELLSGRRFSPLDDEKTYAPIILLKGSNEERIALHIDELIGAQNEMVLKPLGAQLASNDIASAATITGGGGVLLLLDAINLTRNLHLSKRAPANQPVLKVEQQRSILIVDDSVTVRKVTSRLLERAGFDVRLAKDGIDALEKLQEKKPDLMLLDIEMPRMDGFEVATQVKNSSELKDLPIIIISSRTGDKHQTRAFELGVNRFLGKPFQEKELLEQINQLLDIV